MDKWVCILPVNYAGIKFRPDATEERQRVLKLPTAKYGDDPIDKIIPAHFELRESAERVVPKKKSVAKPMDELKKIQEDIERGIVNDVLLKPKKKVEKKKKKWTKFKKDK